MNQYPPMRHNPQNFQFYLSELERLNQFVHSLYMKIEGQIPSSSTGDMQIMRRIKMGKDIVLAKKVIQSYIVNENGIYILINPDTGLPGLIYKHTCEIVKFTFNQFYGEYGKYTGVILNETGKLILKDNLIAKRLNHLNYRPDKLWRNKSTIKKKQVTGNFLKYGGHFIKLVFKGLSFIDKVELCANVLPAGHPIPTQEQIKESTINALIHLCETIEK